MSNYKPLFTIDTELTRPYVQLINEYIRIMTIFGVIAFVHDYSKQVYLIEILLLILLGEALYHLVIQYVVLIK